MFAEFIDTYGELSDSIVISFSYSYGDILSRIPISPSIDIKVYCYNKTKANYEIITVCFKDVTEIQLRDSRNIPIFAVSDAFISETDGIILFDFNPIDHFTHLEQNPDSRFKVKCKYLEYKVIT